MWRRGRSLGENNDAINMIGKWPGESLCRGSDEAAYSVLPIMNELIVGQVRFRMDGLYCVCF